MNQQSGYSNDITCLYQAPRLSPVSPRKKSSLVMTMVTPRGPFTSSHNCSEDIGTVVTVNSSNHDLDADKEAYEPSVSSGIFHNSMHNNQLRDTPIPKKNLILPSIAIPMLPDTDDCSILSSDHFGFDETEWDDDENCNEFDNHDCCIERSDNFGFDKSQLHNNDDIFECDDMVLDEDDDIDSMA